MRMSSNHLNHEKMKLMFRTKEQQQKQVDPLNSTELFSCFQIFYCKSMFSLSRNKISIN